MAGIVDTARTFRGTGVNRGDRAANGGRTPGAIRRGLLLEEKSRPRTDEDHDTISVGRGPVALAGRGIDPRADRRGLTSARSRTPTP